MTNFILRKEGRWFPADYRYPVTCEVKHYWLREAFENYMKMLTGPYERAKVQTGNLSLINQRSTRRESARVPKQSSDWSLSECYAGDIPESCLLCDGPIRDGGMCYANNNHDRLDYLLYICLDCSLGLGWNVGLIDRIRSFKDEKKAKGWL